MVKKSVAFDCVNDRKEKGISSMEIVEIYN